ncbi:lactam utilization protein LamB [Echinicola strongylocentroti]|uniref:Lactam utilization protein LamB n=1 Tax=Echinicola strongylocentroti TaxID=1795355 RepID=A0A2Z4IRI5_9BACT|nr:5-oxoprolinase subunit PxpA [Echinicola strongylocentroti]AWW33288.1 lactam utilization protein LamB [Echinicola strongylocentroti]
MKIDINCDLGEGMKTDADVMPYISSCNIACGGHAGDKASMQATINLALKHHVKIGAHPSYPDRKNFGRETMDIPHSQLSASILEQLQMFDKILKQQNAPLHHIKPHGALYNQAAKDTKTAQLLVDLIKENYPDTILFAPFGSKIGQLAKENNLQVWNEVFADRNYTDDLTLVSRKAPHAIIKGTAKVLSHLERMINDEKVKTLSGKQFPIIADTVCVHGDHPEALALTKAIYQAVKMP